ncbi:hypothetical protein BFW01_g8023 [Lasiodiplodia theobromae]|uniref:Uncharacterized protein n=1 Tax=Lasiodiplodia theobromae TaxID=45133 RepID=A0A5N5DAP1_9PEZI|nr:hypothetical protein DBV05_g6460 [Lasiodiplodia theobromae]KAF9637127.1 hypothetical protein BFW01_g8023 [Lasiodiplodia theobromae]
MSSTKQALPSSPAEGHYGNDMDSQPWVTTRGKRRNGAPNSQRSAENTFRAQSACVSNPFSVLANLDDEENDEEDVSGGEGTAPAPLPSRSASPTSVAAPAVAEDVSTLTSKPELSIEVVPHVAFQPEAVAEDDATSTWQPLPVTEEDLATVWQPEAFADDASTVASLSESSVSSVPPQQASSDELRPRYKSKKLHMRDLTPCRIVFVLNPDDETSWRGHPGLILAVDGTKAHIITLTTWKNKTAVQKWAGSSNPAKFREWFILLDDGRTAGHDGLPVMMLRRNKTMPKICYVDCKRTHWLDISELEKFRAPGGDMDFFVTKESNRALKKHLAYLKTVDTPWINEEGVAEPWGCG